MYQHTYLKLVQLCFGLLISIQPPLPVLLSSPNLHNTAQGPWT
jgi:hypothetical protein